MLLYRMAEWVDFMMGQKDNPKAWSSINRGLKLISDQIERANINITDISTKLADSHAIHFTEGFMLGFSKVLDTLRNREIIDIPEENVMELAEIGVMASSEYIDKVTEKTIDE